jgi:radical SAM superfamily enzyme YgiQ (UPF0313 family)
MNDVMNSITKMKENGGYARILLVMPPDIAGAFSPHLGLGIIANCLESKGYSVLVLDYSYLNLLKITLPKIDDILGVFQPNVIGVSLFSQNLHLSKRFVSHVHQLQPTTPIVLGGPHVSLSLEKSIMEVSAWPGVRTIVRGEVENDIARIIQDVIDGTAEKIIDCKPVEMTNYTRPNFESFIGGMDLETYPIQLSRGCPYQCVFCNIDKLAGRRFRKRDVADCIDEIRETMGRYEKIQYIKVTDDAPNSLSARFEEFLEQFLYQGFRVRLEVMQLRADHLTLKSCQLLKRAGQSFICIGVESADPKILAGVTKGETMADIERACHHVKSADLPLVLCFVLGLPEATKETDLVSIQFARKVQPVHCYWNIAQPMPGTKMHDYFSSKGKIYSENAFQASSLHGGCFADTPEYSRLERLKTQVIAQATTNELTIRSILSFLYRAGSYGVFLRVVQAIFSKRPRISKDTPRRW